MKDLQVIHVHVPQIQIVTGRNPRMELEGIEELAESIEENGVRNPIKVRPNVTKNKHQYELVDGHRRLAACKYLLDTKKIDVDIPAMVVEHYESEVDILVEMMVSNDSLPFAPFEEATLYSRLRDEFKLTNEQIAKRVGKSISHVSDKLALLRADESVKKAVKAKVISISDANTIVRKSRGDTEKQKEIVERVKEEGREVVVDKELKKGRMAKPLWELAENAHDQVWSAMLELGTTECYLALDAENPLQWLEDTANSGIPLVPSLAFGLGQMYVFASVSNLTMRELWDKLEERLVGKKA